MQPGDDQPDVVAFLDGLAGKRVETHGALVFLLADDVLKIKRAVRFDYMDFSSLALRRQALARELEVNRAGAPEIYLGLVPVTRDGDGKLALDGAGEIVEWALRMRRFPDDALFGAIADRGAFDIDLAKRTADEVFAYHQAAPLSQDPGGADALEAIVAEISAGLAEHEDALGSSAVRGFADRCPIRLERVRGLLDRRAAAGFVRRCHGDLHLGNIVLWNGKPTLFDALEFDETLATIDTLYDLAYLVMDLDRRGCRREANVVLNRYLWRSRHLLDIEGLAALPLFLALRAGIRAMVLAERAAQVDDSANPVIEARAYLDAALEYLSPPPARLVAVGGMSGTGKSTIAAALAPLLGAAPGALHLRSDLERKAMHGVGETDRLPPSTYTPEESAAVYARLLDRARTALSAGHAVVADAAFLRETERDTMSSLARSLGVPFHGLWLTAPLETLIGRVEARRGDASDATVDVVRRQSEWRPEGGDWHVVDAGGSPVRALEAARVAIGLSASGA